MIGTPVTDYLPPAIVGASGLALLALAVLSDRDATVVGAFVLGAAVTMLAALYAGEVYAERRRSRRVTRLRHPTSDPYRRRRDR